MANTDKWYFAYTIEGDTITIVDACHAQNMHNKRSEIERMRLCLATCRAKPCYEKRFLKKTDIVRKRDFHKDKHLVYRMLTFFQLKFLFLCQCQK